MIATAFAIEDQISGKEDERSICGQFGETRGGVNVDVAREFRLGLAVRAAAHRGAVDDQLWLLFDECATDRVGIKQVEMFARETENFPLRGEARRELNEIIAEQSGGASDPGEWLGA